MPCQPVIARLLLKENKAKVKRRTPFTIKLTFDSTEYKQPVIAGMDTGSKNIGCAAIVVLLKCGSKNKFVPSAFNLASRIMQNMLYYLFFNYLYLKDKYEF